MYKYLPPERIDVLTSKMICFSNPKNFNDPFEFHSLYDFDYFLRKMKDDLMHLNIVSHLSPEMSKAFLRLSLQDKANFINLSKKTVMGFFAENEKFIENIARESFEKFNDEFMNVTRVLCLSERADNVLMWGHYASSHSGMALELDIKNDFLNQRRSDKDEYGYLRKVKYKDTIDIIDPLGDGVIEHFLSKSKDWGYELEWRAFLPEYQSTKKIGHGYLIFDLFSFPANLIKRVILGCKVTEDYESAIKAVLKNDKEYSHVKLYKCYRSNERYELIISPIDN